MTEGALFTRALEKPPEERAAFLDEACAGNTALRERLEVLLRAHDNPGSFLAEPAPGLGAIADTLAARIVDDAARQRPHGEGTGARIGPYKLLEPIGEGGMGTVYMAEQTAPVRRMVALKVIKAGMDSRQVLARFEAERQALALMDHQHIAKVLDAGATEQGRPYFVMELVDGVPITQFCDERRLTTLERLELFIPVCRAVQHAHQKGIIHRDIKPSNVLVALYDGRPVPKVIDFGVAKATGQRLTEATLFTGFGTLVGTPEYMSPEQAELNQPDIDTRSDIYSLGALFYELLTGTPPLNRGRLKEAALLEVLRVIREDEPPRPSTRLSTIEELPSIAASRGVEPRRLAGLLRGDLDWIAMKALDKDRNRRYETANGLAADVQRYLDNEPVEAGPPSATYRFRKFVRRHRKSVALATLAVAFLLIGTVVSTWQAIRATRAEGLAERRLESEKAERARAVLAERAVKKQLFETLLIQARAARLSRRRGQKSDGLRAIAEASAIARDLDLGPVRFRELRDEAIACLTLVDLNPISSVVASGPPGGIPRTVMDADLNAFARRDPKHEIVIRSLVDGRELGRLGPEAREGTVIEFSPDGRLLALRQKNQPAGEPNVQVWDWRSARIVFRPDLRVDTDAVTFSPDSRFVALGPADGTVRVHEILSGAEVRRLGPGPVATHLKFSPDGGRLAINSQSAWAVRVHEVATGRLVTTLSHPDQVMGLAWHPSDPLLAIANHDHRVYLWDLFQEKPRLVLGGHRHIVHHLDFSPDGRYLLSQGSDGSRLTDLAVNQLVMLLPTAFGRFSRDGRRVAGVWPEKIEVWGVDAPLEYRTLTYRTLTTSGEGRYPECAGQFSPDGRWLATPIWNGAEIWDMRTGRLAARLPVDGINALRFHPNGRELFFGGRGGVDRWPFTYKTGSLTIGPPRKVPGLTSAVGIDLDQAGRLLAAADLRGLWLFDLGSSAAPPRHLEHNGAFFASVSPDGRWVATAATTARPGVRIWDAGSGQVVRELERDSICAVAEFSPDGRWLISGTREQRGLSLLEVESWREVWKLERPDSSVPLLAFSEDASILAVRGAPGLHLLDPGTGRSFATFQVPYDDNLAWLALSSDGSRLAAKILGTNLVGVWDLRQVRKRLAEMGLDWDGPPGPAGPAADAVESISVQVVTAQPEPEKPTAGGDP